MNKALIATNAQRPVHRVAASLLSLSMMSLALPAVARADEASDIAELKRQIQQSRQLIEALTAKVEKLEAEAAARTHAAATPMPETSTQQQVATLQQQVNDLSTAVSSRPTDFGLPLHGFVDVGAGLRSNGTPKGANIGKLDFYLAPQISSHIKGLIELNFEIGDERDASVATDLERLQLGYVFSDAFTLWAGRFHTPYGYWNTAFHHGAQVQTSILRPRFLEFEDAGGILPAHSVGLWGVGKFDAGQGSVGYDLYLANGPHQVECDSGANCILDPNLSTDDNHSAMIGARLHYDFGGAFDGAEIGAHWFRAEVGNDVGSVSRLNVYGGYFSYAVDDWEALGEFYLFSNDAVQGDHGTHTSRAAYLQLGRTLFGQWTPYARVEKTSLDQRDQYFANLESGVSYERGVFGLRYDLTPAAALKLELNRTRDSDRDFYQYNEARVQFAVRF